MEYSNSKRNIKKEERELDEKLVIAIFKNYVKQYDECTKIYVCRKSADENIIFTNVKVTSDQRNFMKDYINERGG